MGKSLIQQKRGKGSCTYRAPSHKFIGEAKLYPMASESFETKVLDIVTSRAHSAPLMKIRKNESETMFSIAPEGIRIGDAISNDLNNINAGSIVKLKDVPRGMFIHNVELNPGDGGKLCRSSGTFARIVSSIGNKITIQLPSKKEKTLNPNCRAAIGIVAGGGRPEKPFMKAGIKFYNKRKKNRLWPIVSGGAMNAVNHPYGNSRSSRKSKVKPCSHGTPPGRKVGMISARRTGKRKK